VDLYPAIDLRDGRCVRLVEGDFGRETVYGDDPVDVARRFASAGARWIHVVDLDAARTGDPVNRPIVERIAGAMGRVGVRVQTGGGVRSLAAASGLLEAGVSRVIIGTAAVENPQLVAEVSSHWPGQVAVGLDHRDGEVRVRGWTEGGGRQVQDLVPPLVSAGASAVIVTDIARDGRLAGPDISGLASLLAATGAPIIASGGVGNLEDVRSLASMPGLIGVIAGKAIYEGRLDVAEAVAVISELSGGSGLSGASELGT
jgi:phosphoribosylformimino-5-aminoimidazole carboxamide ribotide isomerase